MTNPYTSPDTDPENKFAPQSKIVSNNSVMEYIKEFLSPSGSFTRLEFFVSALVVIAIFILWNITYNEALSISESFYTKVKWLIYLLWGVAVGKRAKTVGFNMSSGIVMGLILPFMALIFIFQEGTKDKEVKAAKLARLNPQAPDQP